MQRIVRAFVVGGMIVAAATANAAERRISARFSSTTARKAPALLKPAYILAQNEVPPAPAPEGAPAPTPLPAGAAPVGGPIGLYHCVKYSDVRNVHPCAVPTIVQVTDPCWDPDSCCPPTCVSVEICVPPCACLEVKHSKDGRKVKYDYGEYEVELVSRNGKVFVDYDD
jgi:hypothetical protein